MGHYQRLCMTSYVLTGDADLTKQYAQDVLIELYHKLSSGSLHERIQTFLDQEIARKCLGEREAVPGVPADHLLITNLVNDPELDENLQTLLVGLGLPHERISAIMHRKNEIREGEVSINPDLAVEWYQFSMTHGLAPTPDFQPPVKRETKKSSTRGSFYRIAVAIGIALIIYFGVQRLFNSDSNSNQNSLVTTDHVEQFTFNDGTMVWMNSESKIYFGDDFGKDGRILELEGEAYFDVSDELPQQFKVVMDNAELQTKQGQFNLRNYDEEDLIVISSVDGIGKFVVNGELVETIEPGTVFKFDTKSNEWEKRTSTSENFLGWKEGVLRFEKSGMEDVLEDLESHFRISFDVENSDIYNCNFSGAFQDPDLGDVLDVISNAVELEIEQGPDRTWIISGQGCL